MLINKNVTGLKKLRIKCQHGKCIDKKNLFKVFIPIFEKRKIIFSYDKFVWKDIVRKTTKI